MSGRISDGFDIDLPVNHNATSVFRMIEGRDAFTVFGEAEFYIWKDRFTKIPQKVEYWENLILESQILKRSRLREEIDQQLRKIPTKSCLKKPMTKQRQQTRKQKELDDLLKHTQIMVGKRIRRKVS
jgi:hypothetical protein